jgi:TPR repeat protein
VRTLSISLAGLLLVSCHAFSADSPVPGELTPAEIHESLRRQQFAPVEAHVGRIYQRFLDKEIGEDAVYDMLHIFIPENAVQISSLDGWVAAHPESGVALLVRAYFSKEKGWQARGKKYASQTPRAQFEEMERWFARARENYEAANTKLARCNYCYSGQIGIAMAQSRRADIQRFFKEAMAADPAAESPAIAYYAALSERWGGGRGEQDGFAEHFARMYPDNRANKAIQAEQLSNQADRAGDAGDYAQAVKQYDASLALHETARAHRYKGSVLAKMSRYQEAVDSFSRAISLDAPTIDSNDFEQRGWLYQQLCRFDEAGLDLRRAVDHGSSWAFESLYRQYAGNSGLQAKLDLDKAFDLCNQAVLAGIPEAYWAMGGMYYFGRGVPHDPMKAAEWFERASEKGVAGAKTDLAVMYWQGNGIARNETRAIELWREAAALGDPRGEAKLRENLSFWSYFRHVKFDAWLSALKDNIQQIFELLQYLRLLFL